MPALMRVAFLGDIVGSGGRRIAAEAVVKLREDHAVDVVIANAENARHGSGLTPDMARSLLAAGFGALTLGDHWASARSIVELLEDEAAPIARPANLADAAPGKRVTRVAGISGGDGAGLWVITVLGRLFMKAPANDPFAAVDRELASLGERAPAALVIVEIHAEATSEKLAMLWHCIKRWTGDSGPRVVAVVGTHTHVPTADDRITDGGVATITDLGMTGPVRSILGRDIDDVLAVSRTQMPRALEVARGPAHAQGAIITVDTQQRCSMDIERVVIGDQGATASA